MFTNLYQNQTPTIIFELVYQSSQDSSVGSALDWRVNLGTVCGLNPGKGFETKNCNFQKFELPFYLPLKFEKKSVV